MGDLEKKIGDFFGNLPGLSPAAKETAARYLPWVLIVLGVFGMLAWLSSIRFFFGVLGVAGYFGYVYPGPLFTVHMVLAPIAQIMVIYGGYLMLGRKLQGWRLVFYALLLGVVSHFLAASIFGLVIDFVCAYILFQVREFYAA